MCINHQYRRWFIFIYLSLPLPTMSPSKLKQFWATSKTTTVLIRDSVVIPPGSDLPSTGNSKARAVAISSRSEEAPSLLVWLVNLEKIVSKLF